MCTAESDLCQIKRKRYNKVRRIIYYLYILFLLVIILFLFYHIIDNSTILMYAPDNWHNSKETYEKMYYTTIQDKILIYEYSIIFVFIQIIIATFIFRITKKRNNR